MSTPAGEGRLAVAQELEWLEGFVPRRFLRNGHLQTLAGNFLPRSHAALPLPEARVIEVEAATPGMQASHVLCHCHWQAEAGERLTMILLHGLEGSSRSQYVLGNAARAWEAGYNVVRMNMRNCGGTEHLSPTLYHSGLSGDVLAVMEALMAEMRLQQFALVGYSMGGNLVLKLAGELGAGGARCLRAVVGVSPAMDLAPSADALHEPWNRVYEWKFLRGLRKRFARKVELYPRIYEIASLRGVRTLRDFDDKVTAAYSGFADADHYYARSSSARLAAEIAVPALILHARNDPFVRMLAATREALLRNECVTLMETDSGGHCAFLGPAVLAEDTRDDGYWAEKMVQRFVQAQVQR